MTPLRTGHLTIGLICCIAMAVAPGGCPTIDLPQINPNNRVPEANAGPDKTVCSGDSVTLSAAGSSDADGDSLSYQWTQTLGPQVELSQTGSISAKFTAATAGIYEFTVTVSDGSGGSDEDAVRVTVLTDCGGPDSDGDGVPDSQDGCPNDPNKTSPGNCGCEVADTPDCPGPQVSVPGTSNLWLAGMPAGTTAAGGDAAPAQSPILVSITAAAGGWIEVSNVSGEVANDPGASTYGPEGSSQMVSHYAGAEHSMSDLIAPVDCLIGVFLGDAIPSGSAPSTLDFSTLAARDYLTLNPLLRQTFFIGDGLTSSSSQQRVYIPSGATRLFIGTQDGIGWNNNSGSFAVTFHDLSSEGSQASIPGTSNLWLAGMPAGTTAAGGDAAPAQSPILVSITAAAGGWIEVSNVSGEVANDPGASTYGPEGSSQMVSHYAGAEHSMSDLIAPVDCLIGVFLNDVIPSGSTPSTLDFSTLAARDYLTLNPILRQTFFIGDGLTSSGAQQQVYIPSGATRLFIGTQDGLGWNNNSGSFAVTVQARH